MEQGLDPFQLQRVFVHIFVFYQIELPSEVVFPAFQLPFAYCYILFVDIVEEDVNIE